MQTLIKDHKQTIRDEFLKYDFDFDCSLGVKAQKHFSSVSRMRPITYVWTAQEIYSRHLPRLVRQLSRSNQRRIGYLAVIEHGYEFGRPHVHLLLANAGKLSIESVINTWENMGGGRATVRPFDKTRDTGYAYKHITEACATRFGQDHEVLWDSNLWSGVTPWPISPSEKLTLPNGIVE